MGERNSCGRGGFVVEVVIRVMVGVVLYSGSDGGELRWWMVVGVER